MKANSLKKSRLQVLICLIILLLVYTGLAKLLNFNEFKMQLDRSPYVASFDGLIALSLPLMEIVLALSLAFDRSRKIALYGALYLMTLFTAYIFSMLNFSYYIPCSCGGALESMSWNQHLIFNIAFVLISITAIVLHDHQNQKTLHS